MRQFSPTSLRRPLFARLLTTATLALAAAPALAQQAAAPAPELLPGTFRLVQHTLRDQSWNNQPSHTILAPKGWKVEGGAWYGPEQAFKVFASQEIRITAPDGSEIRIDPDVSFVDNTIVAQNGPQRLPNISLDGGSIVMHYPETLQGFGRVLKKEVLPQSYPKAKKLRLVESVEIADLTEQLRASLEPMRQQFRQLAAQTAGATSHVDGSVMGFEFEYTEGGTEWTHVVLFAQSCFQFEMPSSWNMLGVAGNDKFTTWSMAGSMSFRAPKGQIEDIVNVAVVVRNSLRPTLPWLQMQARHRAKIMQISHEVAMDNLRTAANISRISSRANADILEMQHQGYRDRDAMRDEGQAKLVNSIHEVHEYKVPGETTPVALPSYYDHVYTNGQGEFILTNDANYQPGTDASLTGDWTAASRVR